MEKVVLAFSGGLDTSFCIPYLIKERGFEVYTVMVNTGGFDESQQKELSDRALLLGAKKHINIDAVETYYSKGIKYLLFGNVLKNNTYPLSVSSERVFQALEVLKYAKEIGAEYVAHGSTGAGNDQIRFDLVFEVMAPNIKIIAPIRELSLSRREEIDYLSKHGFDFSWEKAKYSINQGMWGTSVGGVETLSSDGILPSEAFPSKLQREDICRLSIGFTAGEPSSINGEELSPIEIINRLNIIGGEYAISRDIHVGDTIIGIKGRVGFEAPAAMVLIKAHHLLEKHVLTKDQQYWKEMLANWYGKLMHEALYLEPVMRNIEVFLDDTQKSVCGEVVIELRPYSFSVLSCKSSNDLMTSSFGSYGEENRSLTSGDIVGFTKVMANSLKIYYSVNNEN